MIKKLLCEKKKRRHYGFPINLLRGSLKECIENKTKQLVNSKRLMVGVLMNDTIGNLHVWP